jgi:hypothetical protein
MDHMFLEAVLAGLQHQRERIEQQIAKVRTMLGERSRGQATTISEQPQKRKLSAAARKHIGDAQRKRWAAVRKAKMEAPKTIAVNKPRRPKKSAA